MRWLRPEAELADRADARGRQSLRRSAGAVRPWSARIAGELDTSRADLAESSRQLLAARPLRLLRHSLRGFAGRLGISQVVVAERPQLVVELVDQRNAGGGVEPHDLFFGYTVQVLDQGSQAVAVGRDQHPLARAEVGDDRAVPVRQEAGDRI